MYLSDFMHIFALNISAPFIAEFYRDQLAEVLPYADYVIGNESEALAYAKVNDIRVS